ncbi:hypothetical protein ACC810_38975, partial [Rhizobium ruizarguesonis]
QRAQLLFKRRACAVKRIGIVNGKGDLQLRTVAAAADRDPHTGQDRESLPDVVLDFRLALK